MIVDENEEERRYVMIQASMRGVSFGYSDTPCLEDVHLELHSGEFVAITGPNGAAKSTLVKLLLGILKPWQGLVELKHSRELRIGYVPQQIAAFNAGFPSSVLEFVRSGRYGTGSWFRRLTRQDHEMTEEILRQVGMWEFRHRKIGELSGGQKQRICIARALSSQPNLLVLDEPATGMDKDSRAGFYKLINRYVLDLDMTVVMVTHNLEEVQPYLNRIIQLERKEHGGWKCCTTTSCSGHFVPVG
jgi:zinc transport system ATP-binding protein